MSKNTNAGGSSKGADWAREVAAMQAAAAGVDWSKVDWSKLAASDIGVKFGAPMTEEEFREYRKQQGKKPIQIIKKTMTASRPAVDGGTKNS